MANLYDKKLIFLHIIPGFSAIKYHELPLTTSHNAFI